MTDEEIISVLVRTSEPRLRRAWAELLQKLREERTLDELVTLIEQGRTEEVLVRTDPLVRALLAKEITTTYLQAGTRVAERLSATLGVPQRFDLTNDRAVQRVRQADLTLVREISDAQRDVIRQLVGQGVAQGTNPRKVALQIRSSLGLTLQQLEHVESFRRQLEQGSMSVLGRALRDARFDGSVRRAADGTRALTRQQIDTMVDRYRQRYLAKRAEDIARTQALRAVHEGAEEMYRQAIASGALEPERLTCTWNTKVDGRERDWHRSMNGQKRPYGVPFTSGQGNQLRYPCDPSAPASEVLRCRCLKVTRMV